MNHITQPELTALTTKPAQIFDLSPQTFEQALTFANYLAESDMVPKDFKGKPGNCLIAMQWGNELGMKAIQAIQNIAVINGRPAMWGDSVIALVRSSPLCEYVQESDDGHTATCKVKRRGEPEQYRTFGMDDAKTAGLLGKQGPWTQYPKRMRQMRARAFALRDVFPDVLRGMPVAEEAMDIQRDMGPADIVGAPPSPPPSERGTPPPYPQETLDSNIPAWRKAIQEGRATPEALIAKVGSKGLLTEAQKKQIRNLAPIENGTPPEATPPAAGPADEQQTEAHTEGEAQ